MSNPNPDEIVLVECPTCPFCGKRETIAMPYELFQRITTSKGHLQTAAPELNANQREMLMTGSHPECWDTMLDDEDDEDDDDWPDDAA